MLLVVFYYHVSSDVKPAKLMRIAHYDIKHKKNQNTEK